MILPPTAVPDNYPHCRRHSCCVVASDGRTHPDRRGLGNRERSEVDLALRGRGLRSRARASGAFLTGLGSMIRDTAASTALPRLVPDQQLDVANGRLVAGSLVGGKIGTCTRGRRSSKARTASSKSGQQQLKLIIQKRRRPHRVRCRPEEPITSTSSSHPSRTSTMWPTGCLAIKRPGEHPSPTIWRSRICSSSVGRARAVREFGQVDGLGEHPDAGQNRRSVHSPEPVERLHPRQLGLAVHHGQFDIVSGANGRCGRCRRRTSPRPTSLYAANISAVVHDVTVRVRTPTPVRSARQIRRRPEPDRGRLRGRGADGQSAQCSRDPGLALSRCPSPVRAPR